VGRIASRSDRSLMESEVRLSHERSLRDASVLVIGYRGLETHG
jgi:hypothetical protein